MEEKLKSSWGSFLFFVLLLGIFFYLSWEEMKNPFLYLGITLGGILLSLFILRITEGKINSAFKYFLVPVSFTLFTIGFEFQAIDNKSMFIGLGIAAGILLFILRMKLKPGPLIYLRYFLEINLHIYVIFFLWIFQNSILFFEYYYIVFIICVSITAILGNIHIKNLLKAGYTKIPYDLLESDAEFPQLTSYIKPPVFTERLEKDPHFTNILLYDNHKELHFDFILYKYYKCKIRYKVIIRTVDDKTVYQFKGKEQDGFIQSYIYDLGAHRLSSSRISNYLEIEAMESQKPSMSISN